MTWKEKKNNFIIAFSDKKTILTSILGASIILFIQFYFTDVQTLRGNLGLAFTILEVVSGCLLAVLFGLNVGLLLFKLTLARSVSTKEGSSTFLGGIFGVIVTGCPSCSITIASYLGLASIFATLPFHGLEIKVLGILLLVYSTNVLLKTLTTCEKK